MTTGRGRVLAAVRVALLAVVLAAVAVALARNWHEVSGNLARVDPGTLGLAFVLALGSPVLTLLGWRVLLDDLGSPLHMAPAAGVFFVGQLGKYLPGSVWTVVAQAEMGSRLQVPRRRMAVVGLLSIGLAVLTGTVVGIPALPLLASRGESSLSWWWVVLAVLVAVVLARPRVLNAAVRLVLRTLRRAPLEHELSGRAIVRTVAWFAGAWLSAGLSVVVLARAVGPATDPTTLLVTSICGFCLAAAVGMFSFLLPAGVGVRDGVLAFLLTALMPLPAATAVVVLSRFVTVLADVVVAAGGWAWARAHHLLGSRA